MAFDGTLQPKADAERVTLAKKALDEMNLDIDVWIDDLGDSSRATFGDLPNWVVIVAPNGKIHAKLEWAEPENLAKAIPARGRWTKPLPVPVEQDFLKAITSKATNDAPPKKGPVAPHSKHHRHVMLAQLATSHTKHPGRMSWLRELASDGPARQQSWAKDLLAARLQHRPQPDNRGQGQK